MFKELSAQWTSIIFVAGLSFVSTVTIARYIGPSGFGSYSLAISVGSILGIFIDGGFRTLIFKETSKPSGGLKCLTGTLIGSGLAHILVVITPLICISVLVFDRDSLKLSLATIGCFSALVATQMSSAKLRGDGQIAKDAYFLAGSRLTSFLGIIFSLTIGWQAPWQILSVWAFLSVTYLIVFNSGLQRPKFLGLCAIYRRALPFLLLDLSITIYLRSDIILLNFFNIDPIDVGYYSASFKICEGFIMLATPVGMLFFRSLRIMNPRRDAVSFRISRAIKLSLFISLLIAGTSWMVSGEFVTILFGEEFSKSVPIFQILSLMLVFVLPNALLNQACIAMDMENFAFTVALLSAIANIALLAIVLPQYGTVGAAWIKVFTEMLVCIGLGFSLFFFRKRKFRVLS